MRVTRGPACCWRGRTSVAQVEADPGYQLTIDLQAQTVTRPDGKVLHFEIDAFRKHCLLNGLDDIGLTLQDVMCRPSRPRRFMMTRSTAHTEVVQRQFGEQASAYLSSAVHAQGSEFALLQAELAGHADARLLDLGCGAGHVSFHVAPLVAEVVAYDLSQQMLDVVGAAAIERGLNNIVTE
uniref:Methyltransf_25 domain-containing protein n=1 Tax=Steinernema glaseri TaxID=37863 RepID=A0A1I7ZSL1_9BILA